MLLNRRGEYALLGLLYLARQDRSASSGKFWDVGDVAQTVGVPEKYLRILFHQLTKAGLLRSQRGSGGGFGLKKSAAETTVREIVEAIQGPIAPFVCVAGDADPEDCHRFGRCELYGLLRQMKLKIVEELDRHTLSDLIGVELVVPASGPDCQTGTDPRPSETSA
jgi:Rrf2 family transcriptional regulator, iron-sulfur cluster assembly transcription factor